MAVKRRKLRARLADPETGRLEWPTFSGNARQRRYQRRQTVWKRFEIEQAERIAAEFMQKFRSLPVAND